MKRSVFSLLLALFCLAICSAGYAGYWMGTQESEGKYVFEMEELNQERAKAGRAYLSFLNIDTLHCGVYHLAAGAKDGQTPHTEDEIYYVESGVGKFTYGENETDVKPGTILFVPAKMEHRFHSIEEDLTLLVFFSKAKPSGESP